MVAWTDPLESSEPVTNEDRYYRFWTTALIWSAVAAPWIIALGIRLSHFIDDLLG